MSLLDISGRIRFERGEVTVSAAVGSEEEGTAAVASIVSPGTELRQLESTRSGGSRFAGYMNLVEKHDGSRWLAPTPHGAAAVGKGERILPVAPDLPLHYVAASRFQLITAATLFQSTLLQGSVGVFGSGPVALGCILELRRQQATDVHVLSRESTVVATLAPSVRVIESARPRRFDVVFDCTGRIDAPLEAVKDEGILALLGTPASSTTLEALSLHRRGIHVIGMHELRPPPVQYVQRFMEVAAWLSRTVDSGALEATCTRCPGERAPLLYQRLGSRPRLAPFLLFDW